MMPNDDINETLYEMATLIAAYSNPHLFFDLRDIPEVELKAEVESLKNLMGEILG